MSGWVRGIDVSHHQPLDFHIPDGTKFAWVKASEGASFRDKEMAQHHARLKRHGIAVGPYHFYRFNVTPDQNAANFIAATRGLQWNLPHVLDAESGIGTSPEKAATDLLRFLRLVQRDSGRVPVVYTYASWWNANVAPRPEFTQYPLWIARYPSSLNRLEVWPAPGATTAPARPWRDWAVWQFSSAANLDRNVCTEAAYKALLAVHPEPRPPLPILPKEELSVSDAQDIKNAIAALQRDVTHIKTFMDSKPVAIRDPRDNKVWVIGEGTRWWARNRKILNTAIFIGQCAPITTADGVIPVGDPEWIDAFREIGRPITIDLAPEVEV